MARHRKSFAGLVPPLFGSPWYTVAAAGAVWFLFFKKKPQTVTTVVEVGQPVSNGVVPNAAATRPLVQNGEGIATPAPTNSNPYAVEEMLQKVAIAKAENTSMTQGILKQPGTLSGYTRGRNPFKQRNPYMVQ